MNDADPSDADRPAVDPHRGKAVPQQIRSLERMTEVLYPELRRLARGAMRGEGPKHTLQPTALVNEAYLRLAGKSLAVESRAHFLALAARLMRRILIDHARGRSRDKRGGGQSELTLTENAAVGGGPSVEILDLDRALAELAGFDPRRAQLLELQLFGGMTYPEMAEAAGVSEATVHRELRLARAWLQRQLAPSDRS
ncbi:MAG: ECF-type sigma factor [Acidobacteriota bacterium]